LPENLQQGGCEGLEVLAEGSQAPILDHLITVSNSRHMNPTVIPMLATDAGGRLPGAGVFARHGHAAAV